MAQMMPKQENALEQSSKVFKEKERKTPSGGLFHPMKPTTI